MSLRLILSTIIILVAIVLMIKNLKIAGVALALTLLGRGVYYVSTFFEPYMPKSIFNGIAVAIGLVLFALYFGNKLKEESPGETPSTLVILVEFFTETVNNLVISTMGENNIKFAPFIFTLFIYLIVSNIVGIIGLDSPTANYSVTLTLALITFFMTQYFGIKTSGIGGHIKGYFEPIPLLMPLNVMGDLANPVSLSFRLFGNILSGGLIMTLIGAAFGTIATVLSPGLHLYFDLFSGILQAFIFTMLTMVFIAGAIND